MTAILPAQADSRSWPQQPADEEEALAQAIQRSLSVEPALDAEDSSLRHLCDLGATMASSSDGLLAGSSDCAPAAESPKAAEEPAWKVQWKEELMLLKEQVQGGRRPSLLEISSALAKRKRAAK